MATEWVDDDVPDLVRLARILDLELAGELSSSLAAEARHLSDRFGLNPKARRQLRWTIGDVEDTTSGDGDEDEAFERRNALRRRLKVVDVQAAQAAD